MRYVPQPSAQPWPSAVAALEWPGTAGWSAAAAAVYSSTEPTRCPPLRTSSPTLPPSSGQRKTPPTTASPGDEPGGDDCGCYRRSCEPDTHGPTAACRPVVPPLQSHPRRWPPTACSASGEARPASTGWASALSRTYLRPWSECTGQVTQRHAAAALSEPRCATAGRGWTGDRGSRPRASPRGRDPRSTAPHVAPQTGHQYAEPLSDRRSRRSHAPRSRPLTGCAGYTRPARTPAHGRRGPGPQRRPPIDVGQPRR